ncbi:MAG: T9SS type A sorting domain-containing protein [Bacteroidota bacterium]
MKNLLSPFLLLCLCLTSLQAQRTGSFQQNITFDEPDYQFTRTLYFQVPDDYDPDQSYKLVVGFRGGPNVNAGDFRNRIAFLSDSLDAIIVCPENQGHFWNEEGLTKQLFRYSVDTTMAMYNIDPDFIYLTGLSYGGRHAVIVAMDTDDGPIPKLRGVIPFAAGSESDRQPNYSAVASFAPACICIGLNDSDNFRNVANNLHNELQAKGGTSFLNEIPGVGHTVNFANFPDEMMQCINFIEDQYQTTSVKNLPASDPAAIHLFPSPATNIIQWSYTKEIVPLEVMIHNASGQLVQQIEANRTEADLSQLPRGTYLLLVKSKEGLHSRQFSLQ